MFKYLLRYFNLKCSRGCKTEAVGVYYLNKGCYCDSSKIQWLCAQHLVQLEPLGKMKCLVKIWPVKGF